MLVGVYTNVDASAPHVTPYWWHNLRDVLRASFLFALPGHAMSCQFKALPKIYINYLLQHNLPSEFHIPFFVFVSISMRFGAGIRFLVSIAISQQFFKLGFRFEWMSTQFTKNLIKNQINKLFCKPKHALHMKVSEIQSIHASIGLMTSKSSRKHIEDKRTTSFRSIKACFNIQIEVVDDFFYFFLLK